MDALEILRINLLSPMVLAFVLGIIAVVVNSDLEIPEPVYTFLSVYLLLSIGMRGGFLLAESDFGAFIAPALVAIGLGVGIAISSYIIFQRLGKFDAENAAALAIHYCAVSSVTLSAAITLVEEAGLTYEGFMPTLYAVMEIPAIATVMLLYVRQRRAATTQSQGALLRAALTGKGLLLLGGGILIGALTTPAGQEQVAPFFVDLFPGMLALFLLEMGTVVGKRLGDLRKVGGFLIAYGILMPTLHGIVGVACGTLAGLSFGGSFIMGALAAGASYVTAPATVRANLPTANPTYYLTAALVITFPYNLMIGLPLYFQVALLLHR